MKRRLPSFADLPLRDKGLVVVSIPVLALLLALTAMVFVQRAQQEAERLVRHTQDVRQKLQVALTLLVDAETGTRGHLLTGRQEWLDPYRNALRRFPIVVDELKTLVATNPAQAARLRRMQEIAGNRLD